MKTIDKKIHSTEDKTSDITFYIMVIGLGLGFLLTIGYLISTLFE